MPVTTVQKDPPAQPSLHRITASVAFAPNDAESTVVQPAAPQFQLPRFVKLKLLLKILTYVKIATAIFVGGLKVFAICAVASEQDRLRCGLIVDPLEITAFIVYVCVIHVSLTWETQICLGMVGLLTRLKHENYATTNLHMVELNTDLFEYPFLLLLFSIGKFNAFTTTLGNGGVCAAFAYITVITLTIIIYISIAFLVVLLIFRRLVSQLNATAPQPDAENVNEGDAAAGGEVAGT